MLRVTLYHDDLKAYRFIYKPLLSVTFEFARHRHKTIQLPIIG